MDRLQDAYISDLLSSDVRVVDDATPGRAEFLAAVEVLRAELSNVAALHTAAEDRQHVASLQDGLEEFLALDEQATDLVRQNADPDDVEIVVEQAHPVLDEMFAASDSLAAAALERLGQATEDGEDTASRVFWSVLVIGALALVAAAI